MRILMTKFVKKSEITSSWFEIDAKNAVVGRLASVISKIIRGKNKNMTIGFVASSFDIMHPGYILMLKECKDNCNY